MFKRLLLCFLLLASPAAATDIFRDSLPQSTLNVNGSAVVIKPADGVLVGIAVTTAGSAAGSVNDSLTTGGVAAGNLMLVIPNTVGYYYVPARFFNGLVITPGSGQVLSVWWQ